MRTFIERCVLPEPCASLLRKKCVRLWNVDGRSSDKIEQILFEKEENRIPNHIPVVVACYELLSLARFEAFETVYAMMGEQSQGVWSVEV